MVAEPEFTQAEMMQIGKFMQQGMKEPKTRALQDRLTEVIESGGYTWKESLAAVANIQVTLLLAFKAFMNKKKGV